MDREVGDAVAVGIAVDGDAVGLGGVAQFAGDMVEGLVADELEVVVRGVLVFASTIERLILSPSAALKSVMMSFCASRLPGVKSPLR